MKQATLFIEQIKYADGYQTNMSPQKIHLLSFSLALSKKLAIETIAIFKIYPK